MRSTMMRGALCLLLAGFCCGSLQTALAETRPKPEPKYLATPAAERALDSNRGVDASTRAAQPGAGGSAGDSPIMPTFAAAPRSAVEVDSVSGIPYISGGIGVSGREEMEALKSRFNLRLLFAVRGSGSYLADVKVDLEDASGARVLSAVSQGPWFYVSLEPGRYVLKVENAGQQQTRPVTVPAKASVEEAFYWTE